MKRIKGFISDIFRKVYVSIYVALFTFLSVNMAYAAPTFGDMAETVSNQFSSFATLVKYGALLIGAYLVFTGLNDMRQVREKQTTVGACMIKVAIGVALCAFKWIIEAGTATIGGGSTELNEIL